jgi:hypothetical protein
MRPGIRTSVLPARIYIPWQMTSRRLAGYLDRNQRITTIATDTTISKQLKERTPALDARSPIRSAVSTVRHVSPGVSGIGPESR